MRLRPFRRADAATILSWARTPEERDAWASIGASEPDASVFDRWHADDGVRAFGFVVDGALAAYGEIWEDREENEAELARIIVDPAVRGRGIGRAFARALSERARDLGYDNVWVRVVPGNAAAIAAYAAAGFVRTTVELRSRLNRGQPREYLWMRLSAGASPPPRP